MRWSSGAPYRCPAPTQKGRLLSLLSLLGLLGLNDSRGSAGRQSRLRRPRRLSRRGSGMRISQRKFEALVERALGTIPAEIRRRMDNVEILVDAWPDEAHYGTVGLGPGETLFGLYEGVPLIERGIVADPLLPDKITIFQGPLEDACETDDEMAEEIRKTVVHEVAHHFGIDDARLAELGYD